MDRRAGWQKRARGTEAVAGLIAKSGVGGLSEHVRFLKGQA